jgi:hypothetical protein
MIWTRFFYLIRSLPEPPAPWWRRRLLPGCAGVNYVAYNGPTIRAKVLMVKHSMSRGFLGQPKSKASRASVPVIPVLRQMLDVHRARAGNPTEGFIFRGVWGDQLTWTT